MTTCSHKLTQKFLPYPGGKMSPASFGLRGKKITFLCSLPTGHEANHRASEGDVDVHWTSNESDEVLANCTPVGV